MSSDDEDDFELDDELDDEFENIQPFDLDDIVAHVEKKTATRKSRTPGRSPAAGGLNGDEDASLGGTFRLGGTINGTTRITTGTVGDDEDAGGDAFSFLEAARARLRAAPIHAIPGTALRRLRKFVRKMIVARRMVGPTSAERMNSLDAAHGSRFVQYLERNMESRPTVRRLIQSLAVYCIRNPAAALEVATSSGVRTLGIVVQNHGDDFGILDHACGALLTIARRARPTPSDLEPLAQCRPLRAGALAVLAEMGSLHPAALAPHVPGIFEALLAQIPAELAPPHPQELHAASRSFGRLIGAVWRFMEQVATMPEPDDEDIDYEYQLVRLAAILIQPAALSAMLCESANIARSVAASFHAFLEAALLAREEPIKFPPLPIGAAAACLRVVAVTPMPEVQHSVSEGLMLRLPHADEQAAALGEVAVALVSATAPCHFGKLESDVLSTFTFGSEIESPAGSRGLRVADAPPLQHLLLRIGGAVPPMNLGVRGSASSAAGGAARESVSLSVSSPMAPAAPASRSPASHPPPHPANPQPASPAPQKALPPPQPQNGDLPKPVSMRWRRLSSAVKELDPTDLAASPGSVKSAAPRQRQRRSTNILSVVRRAMSAAGVTERPAVDDARLPLALCPSARRLLRCLLGALWAAAPPADAMPDPHLLVALRTAQVVAARRAVDKALELAAPSAAPRSMSFAPLAGGSLAFAFRALEPGNGDSAGRTRAQSTPFLAVGAGATQMPQPNDGASSVESVAEDACEFLALAAGPSRHIAPGCPLGIELRLLLDAVTSCWKRLRTASEAAAMALLATTRTVKAWSAAEAAWAHDDDDVDLPPIAVHALSALALPTPRPTIVEAFAAVALSTVRDDPAALSESSPSAPVPLIRGFVSALRSLGGDADDGRATGSTARGLVIPLLRAAAVAAGFDQRQPPPAHDATGPAALTATGGTGQLTHLLLVLLLTQIAPRGGGGGGSTPIPLSSAAAKESTMLILAVIDCAVRNRWGGVVDGAATVLTHLSSTPATLINSGAMPVLLRVVSQFMDHGMSATAGGSGGGSSGGAGSPNTDLAATARMDQLAATRVDLGATTTARGPVGAAASGGCVVPVLAVLARHCATSTWAAAFRMAAGPIQLVSAIAAMGVGAVLRLPRPVVHLCAFLLAATLSRFSVRDAGGVSDPDARAIGETAIVESMIEITAAEAASAFPLTESQMAVVRQYAQERRMAKVEKLVDVLEDARLRTIEEEGALRGIVEAECFGAMCDAWAARAAALQQMRPTRADAAAGTEIVMASRGVNTRRATLAHAEISAAPASSDVSVGGPVAEWVNVATQTVATRKATPPRQTMDAAPTRRAPSSSSAAASMSTSPSLQRRRPACDAATQTRVAPGPSSGTAAMVEASLAALRAEIEAMTQRDELDALRAAALRERLRLEEVRAAIAADEERLAVAIADFRLEIAATPVPDAPSLNGSASSAGAVGGGGGGPAHGGVRAMMQMAHRRVDPMAPLTGDQDRLRRHARLLRGPTETLIVVAEETGHRLRGELHRARERESARDLELLRYRRHCERRIAAETALLHDRVAAAELHAAAAEKRAAMAAASAFDTRPRSASTTRFDPMSNPGTGASHILLRPRSATTSRRGSRA